MAILLLIWVIFVALAGCAQHVWVHPQHNDPARFNRDSYECERDMRQSGYYGGGLIGQLNAQGFSERCMIARGYYKISQEARSHTPATVTASPAPVSAPVSISAAQAAVVQPVPVNPPSPAPTTTALAQLYLIQGPIVTDPPQAFSAQFNSGGKAQVVLSGRRLLIGDFDLLPIGESVQAKHKPRFVKLGNVKPLAGADAKGFAALSDGSGTELECAYSINRATGLGAGICADNQRNTYRIVFD